MDHRTRLFGSPLLRRVIRSLMLLWLVGCRMSDSRPEKFFERQQLEAARAIVVGDMGRLRAAAHGLDIDGRGEHDMTLLWFAIQEKRFDAIRALVELGSKPDGQVVQGLGIPIDYALLNKDLRFLAAMLDGGLSVNHASRYGQTLLHKAAGAYGATLEHVKLLVERGADLEAKESTGETPLCAAIDTHQPDRARYLLERGASVNVYTVRGATPGWTVHLIIERQEPGSELRHQFVQLRELMIAKGAKFPPDPPEKVRAWMKSQGMRVAE
jgi:uncharacterized protein